MQNFFTQWRENPDADFPYGLAKLKNAFAHLHTIRPWDAEDRIRETGILDDWNDRLEYGQESVPFEAELWFRNNAARRQRSESYLRSIIESLDGEVGPAMYYPGHCLSRYPREKYPAANIQEIVRQPEIRQNVRLLQCESIRHIRPVGQCIIRLSEDMIGTEPLKQERPQRPPNGKPIVALLDGLPLIGHRLLDGYVIVDDPDEFESAYQARERVHGTAMASLICHDDLDEGRNQ